MPPAASNDLRVTPKVAKEAIFGNDTASDAIEARLFPQTEGDARGPYVARGSAAGNIDSAQAYLQGSHGPGQAAAGIPDRTGSGSGKGLIAAWAAENGRLLHKLPWRLNGPRDLGGSEHHVFYDEGSGRYVKVTRGNGDAFGNTLDTSGKRWSIGRATAGEYLDRLKLQNEIFGDDNQVHGVLADRHGNVNIVTSQPDAVGDPMTKEAIQTAMEARGFQALGNSAFYRLSDNILVLDLHEENVVERQGKMKAFDVVTLRPDEKQRAALGLMGLVGLAESPPATPDFPVGGGVFQQ